MKRTKKRAESEVTALGRNPEFLKLLVAARARFAAGRKLSLDEVKRAVLPGRPAKRKKRSAVRKVAR